MIANKSSRDKMGWDYVLERAPEADGVTPLDKRRPFPLCRVQVKTVWKRDAGRVSLTLSAAERLVKPDTPAFVMAFEADEIGGDVEIVSASLIHFRGENLSRILKRLRAASANTAAKPLNEQEITFDLAEGTAITTGSELLAAVRGAIGPDADAYCTAKREELATLGYDGPAFRVDVEFAVDNREHLIDALLGRRTVEVRGTNAVDRRYGMDVPSGHIWNVEAGQRLVAQFRPTPKGDCTIVVRGAHGGPIGFSGSFVSPPVGGEAANQIIVFSTSVFELEVRGSGKVALTMGGPRVEPSRLPLTEWMQLVELLALVHAGPTTFEIREKMSGARMEVPISKTSEPAEAAAGTILGGLVSRIQALWAEAGVRVPDLTQRDFAEAGQDIDVLYRFWHGEQFEELTFEAPNTVGGPTEILMVRVMSVILAGSHLAVAELIVMDGADEGSQHVYRQRERRAAKVEEIGLQDNEIAAFAERVRLANDAHGILTLSAD